ncbi:MAG: diphosphate--fructose-6-phosphate 1-phosphotransferase, partial [Bryocella sp.]
MATGNLIIVQGGGPTPVFNASLAAIIREAQNSPQINKIYGARWGMKGLSANNIVDLTALTPTNLVGLRNSPGAALGSSRYKPTSDDMQHCVENMRQLNVNYVIFMGGNGSMRGAELTRSFCRDNNYDVQIMGVPKTIDNDIFATDRCPGFGSAARWATQATRDLGMDVRSLHQPVSILETMGRNVGWIAGATALAKQGPDDAPHLVYVPEVAFETPRFLADVDALVTRNGWCVVVVSEGIRKADGSLVYESGDPSLADPLSRPMVGGVSTYLASVVAKELKLRCRDEKPGLIGRSSIAMVSAQDRADAELVGREGVRALLAGETDKMVALRPLSEGPNAVELVSLHSAAQGERTIPAAFLSGGPLAVNEAFGAYVGPLMGELISYP